MTGGQLLAWDALDRRRRREAGSGPSALPISLVIGLVGGAALWWVARSAGGAEARTWWAVASTIAVAMVVMAGPWQIYWRPEANLLARLPIDGGALYSLALSRSLRWAAWIFLPVLLGAIGIIVGEAEGVQHLAIARAAEACVPLAAAAAVAAIGAALATPAVTTAAGALVASDRAQSAVQSMAGEFAGPRTIWLSIFPAGAGFAAAWSFYNAAAWRVGWDGFWSNTSLFYLGGIAGGGVLLALLGRPLAARWLPTATREVAALDRVQLAKVETTRAVGLEAAWGRVAAGANAGGGAIYRKDVALARRRYPAYYLVTGAGQIVAWLVSILAEAPKRDRVVIAILIGLGAYAVIFARRLARPPIEEPRLMRTLPIAGAAPRAKGAYAIWRTVVPLVAASAIAVARSHSPLHTGAVVAAIIVLSACGAVIASRERAAALPARTESPI